MMATSLCRFSNLIIHNGSYRNSLGITWTHLTKRCINVQQLMDTTLHPKSEVKVRTHDSSNTDVNSVLEAMNKKNVNLSTAAELLTSLSSVLVDNASLHAQVKENSGFQKICKMLGKDCPNLSHTSLIISYRNLLVIGVPSTDYTFKSVETELLWKLRRMTIKNLLFVLNVCSEFENSELENKVIVEIQRRWVEVTDIRETCILLLHRSKFRNDFISKLEDLTMELVEKAKADEIAKLFVVLANLKLRSTPLLRCMAFHLSKHQEKLDIKKMTNVLCAMNSLSFPDHLLLQRISSDLSSDVNIEKSSNVAAILTSLGQLRWKDEGVLDGFTQWIQKNFDTCRNQDLVAYMLTMAGLNYKPHFGENLLGNLLNRVTEQAIQNPSVWLDVVWSMVVLGVATPQHVASVLKSDYYVKHQEVLNKLKLRSINAAAGLEVLNYKGPTIGAEFFEDVSVLRSKQMQKLTLSVIDALSNFLPRGKFLTVNKMTSIGTVIDAEFIVDSNAKPLPFTELSTNPVASKKMPANAHRVALLVWDYKDFTLNTIGLTGMNALNIRLLQKLGYLTVQIPHTEFAGIKTTLNRVQYLQTKISDAVKAEKQDCDKETVRK